MGVFGDIDSWNPAPGQVTTWRASVASRTLMRHAPHDPIAPTYQQAQHLWNAQHCAARGIGMPRLLITAWTMAGVCDPAAMTAAINDHVRCQRTYHSAFEIHTGDIVRRTIVDPADIEFVPAAEGFMDTEQIHHYVLTSTPTTTVWDCFTFGVIQDVDHFTFYASIDHRHFDGMSMGPLFSDIHHGYQARVHGLPDPVLHTSDYRGYTRRQHQRSASLTLESPQVQDWIDVASDGRWPSFPLPTGDVAGVGHDGPLLGQCTAAGIHLHPLAARPAHSAGARRHGTDGATGLATSQRRRGARHHPADRKDVGPGQDQLSGRHGR